jgi:hypothetical protein
MKLDVSIDPFGGTEGLAIYRCPKCDRLENKFIPPAKRTSRSEPG